MFVLWIIGICLVRRLTGDRSLAYRLPFQSLTCVYCQCVLILFNIGCFQFGDNHKPCDPSFFDDDDFFEATRLIELRLRLMGPNDTPLRLHPTPLVEDKDYPRLNVIGISSPSAALGPQALIKGHVDRRPDGSIQWTLVCDLVFVPFRSLTSFSEVSIYDHQAKWL
jgi:hypothetical protein